MKEKYLTYLHYLQMTERKKTYYIRRPTSLPLNLASRPRMGSNLSPLRNPPGRLALLHHTTRRLVSSPLIPTLTFHGPGTRRLRCTSPQRTPDGTNFMFQTAPLRRHLRSTRRSRVLKGRIDSNRKGSHFLDYHKRKPRSSFAQED